MLQALTYRPTGAVIAAATTSLPEKVGGDANWDYRFGWLRDGSFTLKALWVVACPDEGQRFFDWIAASTGPVGDGHVPIMFGAGGEHDLTEHQLDHLAGYAGSRPVRVGNDAWTQQQLDVLGEVLECAWVLRDSSTSWPRPPPRSCAPSPTAPPPAGGSLTPGSGRAARVSGTT